MDSVLTSISNRHGEAVIRMKFRIWVHRFALISATFEEIVYGASALHIGASETDADAYGYGVCGHGLVWPDDASRMREIQAQVGRVEGWRQSRSYFSLVRDLARLWERGEGVRGIDLGFQVERLRGLKVGDAGAGEVYMAISRAVERAGLDFDEEDFDDEAEDLIPTSATPASAGGAATTSTPTTAPIVTTPAPASAPQPPPIDTSPSAIRAREKRLARRAKARYDIINQLLIALPESGGGLFYLSLGLFHKDPAVRLAVVALLERVMVHDAGRHFWASLGRFAKLAFFRVKREGEGKGLG
jgi:hypothetical protein